MVFAIFTPPGPDHMQVGCVIESTSGRHLSLSLTEGEGFAFCPVRWLKIPTSSPSPEVPSSSHLGLSPPPSPPKATQQGQASTRE